MRKPVHFDERVKHLNGMPFGNSFYKVVPTNVPGYSDERWSGLFFRKEETADTSSRLFVGINWPDGVSPAFCPIVEFRECEADNGVGEIVLKKIVVPIEHFRTFSAFYQWLNLTIPSIERL